MRVQWLASRSSRRRHSIGCGQLLRPLAELALADAFGVLFVTQSFRRVVRSYSIHTDSREDNCCQPHPSIIAVKQPRDVAVATT